MAEFVDKGYLIKWIESRKRLSKMETILFIQDAPTTVLRDVVRCKDCKHSSYDPVHGDYWCGGQRVFAEHFCSVGERREGE